MLTYTRHGFGLRICRERASYHETFDMPFGKMTIALDDFNCLTWLLVTRLHVSLTGHAEERQHELVAWKFELSEAFAILSLAKSD